MWTAHAMQKKPQCKKGLKTLASKKIKNKKQNSKFVGKKDRQRRGVSASSSEEPWGGEHRGYQEGQV